MTQERKTISKATEDLSGNLQFFTVYTSVDITATGNYEDKSQKIFDSMIAIISMRAQPVILASPYQVSEMENEGASELTGAGYIFKFVVEHSEIFAKVNEDQEIDDPVYFLKYAFEDIEIEEENFVTEGTGVNIEFTLNEEL